MEHELQLKFLYSQTKPNRTQKGLLIFQKTSSFCCKWSKTKFWIAFWFHMQDICLGKFLFPCYNPKLTETIKLSRLFSQQYFQKELMDRRYFGHEDRQSSREGIKSIICCWVCSSILTNVQVFPRVIEETWVYQSYSVLVRIV